MRVVLSRKGFDSSYGGYPSPILPDGSLLSLPIPSSGDGLHYSDLQYNEDYSYFQLMNQLKSTIKTPEKGSFELKRTTECHLDPDLIPNLIPRSNSWKPIFGQINQAQSHLENQDIGIGDLFLFFGWFRQSEWVGGKLQFVKNAPDLHIIHSYLQIGQILQPERLSDVPEWASYHPHIMNDSRFQKDTNTLYIAKTSLNFASDLPGGGPLHFDNKLVLTKEGQTRSIWILPEFMKNLSITYHSQKSWNRNGSFNSARIGQEFVIEKNSAVTDWAKSLIVSFQPDF